MRGGMGLRTMADTPKPREDVAARKLAIAGALVTGATGVAMAVYSVFSGEATGGGALLAASALAFGLLALNLNQPPFGSASQQPPTNAGARDGRVAQGEPEVQPAAAASARKTGGLSRVPPMSSSHVLRRSQAGFEKVHVEPLTGREWEVLSLVAEGYSNKLVSAKLGISERTVKNHLTLTMGKLQASDRTHAVVTAIQLGWLDVSQGSPPP